MGPKYAAWRFGPEDTDQVIRGMAGDWCRVVVQRQKPADTGLKEVARLARDAIAFLFLVGARRALAPAPDGPPARDGDPGR